MSEMVHMKWTHPHRGEIFETVCPTHESELLRALRLLGIGCVASRGEKGKCSRCAHSGTPPQQWLGAP